MAFYKVKVQNRHLWLQNHTNEEIYFSDNKDISKENSSLIPRQTTFDLVNTSHTLHISDLNRWTQFKIRIYESNTACEVVIADIVYSKITKTPLWKTLNE